MTHRWRAEAIGIRILPAGQPGTRIADQNRPNGSSIGTYHQLVVPVGAVGQMSAELEQGSQRRTALYLGYSGQLPSAQGALQERIVEGSGQHHAIGHAESMRSVVCQRPVLAPPAVELVHQIRAE